MKKKQSNQNQALIECIERDIAEHNEMIDILNEMQDEQFSQPEPPDFTDYLAIESLIDEEEEELSFDIRQLMELSDSEPN